MTTIKTAVSLQESLFKQVEKMAREMHVSRSHLFSLALEDFIRRQENRTLLEQINRAYDDLADEDDMPDQDMIRNQMRRIADDKW